MVPHRPARQFLFFRHAVFASEWRYGQSVQQKQLVETYLTMQELKCARLWQEHVSVLLVENFKDYNYDNVVYLVKLS